MKKRQNIVRAACLFSLLLSSECWAASPNSAWPQFRGPSGNGVAPEAHPSEWNAKDNLAWSAEIAGGGWSSPVVAGDKIFVTTAVSADQARLSFAFHSLG